MLRTVGVAASQSGVNVIVHGYVDQLPQGLTRPGPIGLFNRIACELGKGPGVAAVRVLGSVINGVEGGPI